MRETRRNRGLGAVHCLLGDHAAASERGTAHGLYHLTSGVLVLPGALWRRFGSATAFAVAALVTGMAAIVLLRLARPERPEHP